jgi:hypothetical protein
MGNIAPDTWNIFSIVASRSSFSSKLFRICLASVAEGGELWVFFVWSVQVLNNWLEMLLQICNAGGV